MRKVRLLIVISIILVVAISSITFFTLKYSFRKEKGKVLLIGAEAVYGDMLKELTYGINKIQVETIVSKNVDPHEFEPSFKDKRKLLASDLTVANGLGYDNWVEKITHKNVVLAKDSKLTLIPNNPHIFFSPLNMMQITAYIYHDKMRTLSQLSDSDREKIDENYSAFLTRLNSAVDLEMALSRKYIDTPVEITESLPQYMLNDLNFIVLTQNSFLAAVMNGETPSRSDIQSIEGRLSNKSAKLLIYNAQNINPSINKLKQVAEKHRVGVVDIYETPQNNEHLSEWYIETLNAIKDKLSIQ
jgi:zinc/manganese transport system substrate-binding protein